MRKKTPSDPDPQQELIRLMEKHEFRGLDHHTITLKRLKKAIRKLSKSFGVPVPKLTIRNEPGCVAAYHYDNRGWHLIALGSDWRNLFTLAHEFAHHYVWLACGNRAQDHGPTFVRAYACALQVLRMMPMESFLFACKKYGIKSSRA